MRRRWIVFAALLTTISLHAQTTFTLQTRS